MIQRGIVSEAGCVTKMRLTTKHTQPAEKALMNVLTTSYTATTNGRKNVFLVPHKTTHTKVTFEVTMNDLFLWSLDRWSHAPKNYERLYANCPYAENLQKPTGHICQAISGHYGRWVASERQRQNSPVWRVVTSSITTINAGFIFKPNLRDLAHRELEHVHACKPRIKSQKVWKKRMCLPFPLPSIHQKCTSLTPPSADRNNRVKGRHQQQDSLTKPHLPVHRSAKLRYVRAVDCRTYRLNKSLASYEVYSSHHILKIFDKLCFYLKAHSFDLADLISVLRFLTAFKLACDVSRIYKVATIWAMPYFVVHHITSSLSNRMDKVTTTKTLQRLRVLMRAPCRLSDFDLTRKWWTT